MTNRSESLKRYWSIVKQQASETGRTTAEVRRDLKGKIFPSKEQSHIYGDEYYYVVRPKRGRGKSPVTIRSNDLLNEEEIKSSAAMYYNAHKEDYGETDGRYWNEDDLIVAGGSRQAPLFDDEEEV